MECCGKEYLYEVKRYLQIAYDKKILNNNGMVTKEIEKRIEIELAKPDFPAEESNKSQDIAIGHSEGIKQGSDPLGGSALPKILKKRGRKLGSKSKKTLAQIETQQEQNKMIILLKKEDSNNPTLMDLREKEVNQLQKVEEFPNHKFNTLNQENQIASFEKQQYQQIYGQGFRPSFQHPAQINKKRTNEEMHSSFFDNQFDCSITTKDTEKSFEPILTKKMSKEIDEFDFGTYQLKQFQRYQNTKLEEYKLLENKRKSDGVNKFEEKNKLEELRHQHVQQISFAQTLNIFINNEIPSLNQIFESKFSGFQKFGEKSHLTIQFEQNRKNYFIDLRNHLCIEILQSQNQIKEKREEDAKQRIKLFFELLINTSAYSELDTFKFSLAFDMSQIQSFLEKELEQITMRLEEHLRINFWPKKYKFTREKGSKEKQMEVSEELERNKLQLNENKQMLFELQKKRFEIDKTDQFQRREIIKLENYLIKRHQDERKLSKKLQLHNQMKNFIMYSIRFVAKSIKYEDENEMVYHRKILESFHLTYNKSDLQALTFPYESYTLDSLSLILTLQNDPKEQFKQLKHFMFQKQMISKYNKQLIDELCSDKKLIDDSDPISLSNHEINNLIASPEKLEKFNFEVSRLKKFNQQNRIHMQIFCLFEYQEIILKGKGNKIDHLYGNNFILRALQSPEIIQR